MQTKLTVLFEDPFWVGIFERWGEGAYSVCKVTFGAEPTDNDVLAFVMRHYGELRFTPAVKTEAKQTADNPKRRRREAAKLTQSTGIGTRAQQALAAQREANKTERERISKEQREAEKERRFTLKQQKKKEKKRGH